MTEKWKPRKKLLLLPEKDNVFTAHRLSSPPQNLLCGEDIQVSPHCQDAEGFLSRHKPKHTALLFSLILSSHSFQSLPAFPPTKQQYHGNGCEGWKLDGSLRDLHSKDNSISAAPSKAVLNLAAPRRSNTPVLPGSAVSLPARLGSCCSRNADQLGVRTLRGEQALCSWAGLLQQQRVRDEEAQTTEESS